MEKNDLLKWFEEHPDRVHGDLHAVVAQCERSVRRHAREAAWIAAKRFVGKRRDTEAGDLGAHASEVYVAREVCHQIADELLRHEPRLEAGAEDRLAGGPVKAAVEGEGWEVLVPWILEVAREEEHRTWLEIARYTNHLAVQLVERHHLSDDTQFDHTRCFGEIAQRIERLLEQDFARHAYPRAGLDPATR
jgi:hypothetical protein